jgi:hypothetical protein
MLRYGEKKEKKNGFCFLENAVNRNFISYSNLTKYKNCMCKFWTGGVENILMNEFLYILYTSSFIYEVILHCI